MSDPLAMLINYTLKVLDLPAVPVDQSPESELRQQFLPAFPECATPQGLTRASPNNVFCTPTTEPPRKILFSSPADIGKPTKNYYSQKYGQVKTIKDSTTPYTPAAAADQNKYADSHFKPILPFELLTTPRQNCVNNDKMVSVPKAYSAPAPYPNGPYSQSRGI